MTKIATPQTIGMALRRAGIPKRLAPKAQYNINGCEVQCMGNGQGYGLGWHTPGCPISVFVYGEYTLAQVEAALKAAGFDTEIRNGSVEVK